MPSPFDGRIFDRQGQPLTFERWCELRYQDEDYWRVGLDYVGAYEVSTVWLGLNHGYQPDRPPVIFETMVFLNSEGEDVAGLDMGCWRYSTEAEAIEGHKATLLLIEATVGVQVVDEAEVEEEVND